MTRLRPWLADPQVLPRELQQALAHDHVAPDTEQLRDLAEQLGQTLGMALAPPPPISIVETVAASKPAAAATVLAAKPLAVLGAWVFGGVVLGAGLSGIAQLALPPDSPAPQGRARPEPVRHPKPGLVAPGPQIEAPPQSAPAQSAAVTEATAAGLARGSASPAAQAPAASAETEFELLKRAQLALVTDPSLALSLVNVHVARFVQPELDQEREMIAIDALRRLGRGDEARRRGAAFRARYPRSAHLHRLEGLLQDSSR